ncbi:MAG: hypothetical protein WC641_06925 [Patescibacteria group bacterium]
MDMTVDQQKSYSLIQGADTHRNCLFCGAGACRRSYSTLQVRLAGYTVSAVVPSKRCTACGRSRIGADDASLVSATALAELLRRGIRDVEMLGSSRCLPLVMQRIAMDAILDGKHAPRRVDLNKDKLSEKEWKALAGYIERYLLELKQYRPLIPIRVTAPRKR